MIMSINIYINQSSNKTHGIGWEGGNLIGNNIGHYDQAKNLA